MSAFCSISWEALDQNNFHSSLGLRKLSPKLTRLRRLPYSAQKLREEAVSRADKVSIQGVQPKVSAALNIKEQCFKLVDRGGRYILKPPHLVYSDVPENEALTMSMAHRVGIETPLHGLIKSEDGCNIFFIKRFDRAGQNKKIHQEDFAQLLGRHRETKYDSSIEKVIDVINRYCTFPVIERQKLFVRIIFCYLTGNEDMHLKNFSLLMQNNKILLSPVYDVLNTTIILSRPSEEMALPINGKKNKLSKKDLLQYFGMERCEVKAAMIQKLLQAFNQVRPDWERMIFQSFLSSAQQKKYLDLLSDRFGVLL